MCGRADYGLKMFLFPSLLLFLASLWLTVEDGGAVKCTIKEYNPCRCILSDGYRGIVDLMPIFQDGALVVDTT